MSETNKEFKLGTETREVDQLKGVTTVTDPDGIKTTTINETAAVKRIKVTIERFDADDNQVECVVINNAEGICLFKLDEQPNPDVTATEGFITGGKFDLRMMARELNKLLKSRGLLNDPIRDLFSRLFEMEQDMSASGDEQQTEHLCSECAGAEDCPLPQAIKYRAERDKVDTMPDRDYTSDFYEDTETQVDTDALDKQIAKDNKDLH